MDDRLESGFGGRADEKIQTAREAAPLLSRKKSHPQHLTVSPLGFAAEFIPIYQRHPDAECYAICQRNKKHLNEIGDQFGIKKRFTKFADLLSFTSTGNEPQTAAFSALPGQFRATCSKNAGIFSKFPGK